MSHQEFQDSAAIGQAQALGLALGVQDSMKLLHSLGTATGESVFVEGKGSGGPDVLTPEVAKAEIKTLMSDNDFQRRRANGDKEAKSKWDRLHEQGWPGTVSL